MPDLLTTRFLVLRRTPYSESSLVLAGLSPEAGQLHFMARGIRKLGKKQFPLADLFDVVTVQYGPSRGSLHTWKSAEAAASYRGVAASTVRFEAACRLAKFALANMHEGLAAPRFFAALEIALARLADPAEDEKNAASASFVGIALVFLEEHGLLPDYQENERLQRQRDRLLNAAETAGPAPVLPAADWQKLEKWAVALLKHHDCRE